MITKVLLVALLSAGVVGCSQEAPPTPSGPSTPAAMPEVTPPAPEVAKTLPPVGDATFSMTPGSFRVCDAENGAITSVAKWDVTTKNIAQVSIYVIDAKGEKKLWLNGSPSGESSTGNWVFPDSKFQLVERESQQLISELIVKALPCE